MRATLALIALFCAPFELARADARTPTLRLEELPTPSPTSLRMRAAQAAPASQGAEPAPIETGLPPDAPIDRIPRDLLMRDVVNPPDRLSERVIFRFNLGFGLDGGNPSGDALLSGSEFDTDSAYERLRVFAFGDAVVGSQGIVSQSLSTYFASQFRFDQNVSEPSTAAPSVYDTGGVGPVLVRSAYAEADDLFEREKLRPFYVRAGRQFQYGVAMAHFTGLTVGYDTPSFDAQAYIGEPVVVYDPRITLDESVLGGADIRFDFFELRGIPLVVTGSTISYNDLSHSEGGLALRWSRDMLLRGSVKTVDGDLARETLSLRTRLSEVTTVSAEIGNRSPGDTRFDFLLVDQQRDKLEPRYYLDLGPPLPRTHLDVRAGTVLLRNLDLLFRAAGAVEHARGQAASQSASYIEGGSAVEVQLRRSIRLGSSLSARRYFLQREDFMLTAGIPDMLPADTGSVGIRSFAESGLSGNFSAGARRFSTTAEVYGRLYGPETAYDNPSAEELTLRSGGRFSVEGWAGERVRLRAEYDVSFNRIQLAPELTGLKSLRVLMEGTF